MNRQEHYLNACSFEDEENKQCKPPELVCFNEKDKKIEHDSKSDTRVGSPKQLGLHSHKSIEQMFDSIIHSMTDTRASTSDTSANDMDLHTSSIGGNNSHHLGGEDDGHKGKEDSKITRCNASHDRRVNASKEGTQPNENQIINPARKDGCGKNKLSSGKGELSGLDQRRSRSNSGASRVESLMKAHLAAIAASRESLQTRSAYAVLHEELSIDDTSFDGNSEVSEFSRTSSRTGRSWTKSTASRSIPRTMSMSLDRVRSAARGLKQRVESRSLSPRYTPAVVSRVINAGRSFVKKSKGALQALSCLPSEHGLEESELTDIETASRQNTALQKQLRCTQRLIKPHTRDEEINETISDISKTSSDNPFGTADKVAIGRVKQNAPGFGSSNGSWLPVSTLVGFFEHIDQEGTTQGGTCQKTLSVGGNIPMNGKRAPDIDTEEIEQVDSRKGGSPSKKARICQIASKAGNVPYGMESIREEVRNEIQVLQEHTVQMSVRDEQNVDTNKRLIIHHKERCFEKCCEAEPENRALENKHEMQSEKIKTKLSEFNGSTTDKDQDVPYPVIRGAPRIAGKNQCLITSSEVDSENETENESSKAPNSVKEQEETSPFLDLSLERSKELVGSIQNAIQVQNFQDFELTIAPKLIESPSVDHSSSVSMSLSSYGKEEAAETTTSIMRTGQKSPQEGESRNQRTGQLWPNNSAPPPNSPNAVLCLDGKSVITTISLFETRSALCHSSILDPDNDATNREAMVSHSADGRLGSTSKQEMHLGECSCSVPENKKGLIGKLETRSSDVIELANSKIGPNTMGRILSQRCSDVEICPKTEKVENVPNDTSNLSEGETLFDPPTPEKRNTDSQPDFESSAKYILAGDGAFPDTCVVEATQDEMSPQSDCTLLPVNINDIAFPTLSDCADDSFHQEGYSSEHSGLDADDSDMVVKREHVSTAYEKFLEEKHPKKIFNFLTFSKIPEEPESNEALDELPSPPSASPGSSSCHCEDDSPKRCSFYEEDLQQSTKAGSTNAQDANASIALDADTHQANGQRAEGGNGLVCHDARISQTPVTECGSGWQVFDKTAFPNSASCQAALNFQSISVPVIRVDESGMYQGNEETNTKCCFSCPGIVAVDKETLSSLPTTANGTEIPSCPLLTVSVHNKDTSDTFSKNDGQYFSPKNDTLMSENNDGRLVETRENDSKVKLKTVPSLMKSCEWKVMEALGMEQRSFDPKTDSTEGRGYPPQENSHSHLPEAPALKWTCSPKNTKPKATEVEILDSNSCLCKAKPIKSIECMGKPQGNSTGCQPRACLPRPNTNTTECSSSGTESKDRSPRCIRWDIHSPEEESQQNLDILFSDEEELSTDRSNSCMMDKIHTKHWQFDLEDYVDSRCISKPFRYEDHRREDGCKRWSLYFQNSNFTSTSVENASNHAKIRGKGPRFIENKSIASNVNVVCCDVMKSPEFYNAKSLDQIPCIYPPGTVKLQSASSSVEKSRVTKYATEHDPLYCNASYAHSNAGEYTVEEQHQVAYLAGLEGLWKTGQLQQEDSEVENVRLTKRRATTLSGIGSISRDSGIGSSPRDSGIGSSPHFTAAPPTLLLGNKDDLIRDTTLNSREKPWEAPLHQPALSSRVGNLSEAETIDSPAKTSSSVPAFACSKSILVKQSISFQNETVQQEKERSFKGIHEWEPLRQPRSDVLSHKLDASSKKLIQTIDFVERARKRIDECNALIDKSMNTLRMSSEVSRMCRYRLQNINHLLSQKPAEWSQADRK